MDTQDYVSVIGLSFLHPIATLLEKLESFGTAGPNEVQASPLENGYASATVALSVLMLESVINRVRYIRGDKARTTPVEFMKKTFPSYSEIDKVEALFVVRDVIAHNHIWDTQIEWDDQEGLKLASSPQLEPIYGDKKFQKVIDEKSRRTRLLQINLFPTRICRADAIIVVKNVTEILRFLEKEDRRYIYVEPQIVKFQGDLVNFVDMVNELK